jgi:CheY-like chemotaxis protein
MPDQPMPKTILIVEDEEALRALYEQLMKGEGFNVVTSGDGNDALNKLLQGGYDMVLLDIMLPGIDGLHILEQLKNTPPAKPNGKIVLLTNLAENETIGEALKKGVDGYIIKSRYSPEEFIAAVKKIMDGDQVATTS